jgi:osmotically-inducible protein OsmY
VTSYSGKVLLTGEVPTAAIREQIEKIASSDAVRAGRDE